MERKEVLLSLYQAKYMLDDKYQKLILESICENINNLNISYIDSKKLLDRFCDTFKLMNDYSIELINQSFENIFNNVDS